MRIDEQLQRILAATADKAAAEATIARLRGELEKVALARYAADGAAPTWKSRTLGAVRLDKADAPAAVQVLKEEAYGSWLAEHHPEHAVATITLPAGQLEEALRVLDLAVDGVTAKVVPGPTAPDWLKDNSRVVADADAPGSWVVQEVALEYDDDGQAIKVEVLGTIPGLTAVRPRPSLVVTLDPALKKARQLQAIREVEAAFDDPDPIEDPEEPPAAPVDPWPTDPDAPSPVPVPEARTPEHADNFDTYSGPELRTACIDAGLPKTGTNATLIARLREHIAAQGVTR